MTWTLSLSEVKTHLSKLIPKVAKGGDGILITRNKKPVAVLIDIREFEEYESWKETQEIKRDPELMRGIRKSLKAFEQGKWKRFDNLDELFGESSQ